jgi:hypothetical protein
MLEENARQTPHIKQQEAGQNLQDSNHLTFYIRLLLALTTPYIVIAI